MTRRALRPVDSSFDSDSRRPPADAGGHRRTAARRGNREGSVYQRADGRWVAQATSPSGARLYRYARTRAEASAKLTAALTAFSEHRTPPPERLFICADGEADKALGNETIRFHPDENFFR